MKNIARVRRDGEAIEIEAEGLVPGDIVLMEAGNRVPADGRLFVAATLEIEEAALTGESVASPKDTETITKPEVPLGDRRCMAFMNTSVTRGRGEMIVTTTGMGTEMGHIADLLNKTESDKTPLQKQLDRLTIIIACLAGVAFVLMVIMGLQPRRCPQYDLHRRHSPGDRCHPDRPARGRDHHVLDGHAGVGRSKRHRQAAAVGRDAGLGFGDLLGQDRHAHAQQDDGARVHHPRPEPLQGDRRGLRHARDDAAGQWHRGPAALAEKHPVLQHRRQAAQRRRRQDRSRPDPAADGACAPTPVWTTAALIGDPTEGALIVLAEKGGIHVDGAREMYPRVAEVPFDSDYKFMATFHNMINEQGKPVVRCFVKGAPDVLIARSASYWMPAGEVRPVTDENRPLALQENDRMAEQGERVMVVARRTAREPGLPVRHVWERLLDEHDADVSYATVRDYVLRLRAGIPGQEP